jgi:chromosome partitioning protein
MTRIIAIANQKGGVGKTTTAINLSSALAHFGRKVLLLDMDPQGNAGRGLGVDINLQKHTIYEVIAEGRNPTQAILTTSFEGVDVIPANLRLAQFEGKNEGGVHPFSVLKNALAKLPKDHYDYIVVDCPPSLGLLCLNSLVAADAVLIPVQCEYFAMEAVAAILSSVAKVQREWNSRLTIEGFLLTMFDNRLRLSNQVYEEVKRHFGDLVFNTVIARNVRLSEAPSHGVSVLEYDPQSKGAQNYIALAKELIKRQEA